MEIVEERVRKRSYQGKRRRIVAIYVII